MSLSRPCPGYPSYYQDPQINKDGLGRFPKYMAGYTKYGTKPPERAAFGIATRSATLHRIYARRMLFLL
jgi:hypothetical protein